MIFWNKKRISWIGIYFIPFTLLNIIISIIMVAIGFFRSFNLTLIFFIIFELFAVVTIIFGMLFSTFFNKAKSAGKLVNTIWNLSILFKIWVFFIGAACGAFYSIISLLYFVVFLPREAGIDIPMVAQWFLSLLFPCAFSLAIDQVRINNKNEANT